MRKIVLLIMAVLSLYIISCKKEDLTPNNIFTNDPRQQTGGIDTVTPPVDTTGHVDTIPVTPACDTSNVTYTNIVSGIMQRNCVSCHPSEGDDDDDDDDDDDGKLMESEDPALTTYAEVVHAVNEEGANKIIRMINHTTEPMPPSYMMSACERRQLAIWIARGMPQ